MIFVTLGSQKFQFNRLLKAVDELVMNEMINEEVFAQIGYSDYKPKAYKYKEFLNRDEFADIMERADTIITHGGTGAIIGAVKKRKKVIAVARLEKYGEHVDNHQIQIVKQFADMDLICACQDCNELMIALENVKLKKYKPYKSNTDVIIQSIENFIDGEVKK